MKWIKPESGSYQLVVDNPVGVCICRQDRLWHVYEMGKEVGVYPTLKMAKEQSEKLFALGDMVLSWVK